MIRNLQTTRRRVLTGVGALATVGALEQRRLSAAPVDFDLIIVGAGTAGMPAAIFASDRGASVLMIDAAPTLGGTLNIAGGEICGAGTNTQKRFGVTGDHPDIHFEDVMRLSNGLADPAIVRRTVDGAASMIDWIDDRGWDCRPDHVTTGASLGRPGYSVRRYLQAKNKGKAIAEVFIREVNTRLANGANARGKIEVLTSTRVSELLTTDSGAVEGVRADTEGLMSTFRGRNILITTGGYPANPSLFRKFNNAPLYLMEGFKYCAGDGLTMATDVGAALRGHDLYSPGSGSVLSGYTFPAEYYVRFDTRPQKRLPWEIWVNDHGLRYINEETPNHSTRGQTLKKQPDLRYAIVFDDTIFNSAPPGIQSWSRDRVASQFNSHPMFHKADTIEELARRAGIDRTGLSATVAAYNAGIEDGADPFGRIHRPVPLATPPFYAIVQLGHSATSAVGITVNDNLQALAADGTPISNLYAAGEAIGSGATCGNVGVPGMMITPAMTLGRHVGTTVPLA